MNDATEQPKPHEKLAAAFREMADMIEKNADRTFGGAFVIAPPGDSEIITTVLFDSRRDLGQFYGLIQGKCTAVLFEISEAHRQGRAIGMR